MSHLLVDAMNVIGSRPTGWWRDRDAAVSALLARLQAYAAANSVAITLFVDGGPLPDLPEGSQAGVVVLYASRAGRNGADDRLVQFIQVHPSPASLHVITSDRDLAARARARGSPVYGASTLLDQLDRTPGSP